jgi:hypothetical protein
MPNGSVFPERNEHQRKWLAVLAAVKLRIARRVLLRLFEDE